MPGINKNIEEIKLLLPDYISGNIESGDKKLVEDAFENSPELQELFNEMTGTFGFVSKVKFKEPDTLYWTNLLPRIHERLEKTEERKFSWEKVLSYWKVFVPVTAVILLAVVYFTVLNKNDESTITEKKIEKIDTSRKIENTEKKEIVKDNNTNTTEQEKKIPVDKKILKHYPSKYDKTDEKPVQDKILKETPKQEEPELYTEIDIEEEAVFTGGTAGMVDDEIESGLNTLNRNEQDELLKELINSNL